MGPVPLHQLRWSPSPLAGRNALSYFHQICEGARAMLLPTAPDFVLARSAGSRRFYFVMTVVQAVQPC